MISSGKSGLQQEWAAEKRAVILTVTDTCRGRSRLS
jgi:hypothetical protein